MRMVFGTDSKYENAEVLEPASGLLPRETATSQFFASKRVDVVAVLDWSPIQDARLSYIVSGDIELGLVCVNQGTSTRAFMALRSVHNLRASACQKRGSALRGRL